MSENHIISFTTESNIRYNSDFDVVNCEKVYLADIDGDGQQEIIIPGTSSSNGRFMAEIAVYDFDTPSAGFDTSRFSGLLNPAPQSKDLTLNLKASDSWNGTAMDVIAADIDGDGTAEIITTGSVDNSSPTIRVYRYHESDRGHLELLSQTCWQSLDDLAGAARSVHVIEGDDGSEIVVLTIVEGHEEKTGYAQLRVYDTEMQLRKTVEWTPVGGSVVRNGHCMVVADVDGDGHNEILTLTSFRHEDIQKAELRVFDHCLCLKQKCEALVDEAILATRMLTGDIDGDGESEIVVAGGMHTEAGRGATSQLIIFDRNLHLKSGTTWKTFRHSWVWDLQIADIDGDGNQEIITYGGTSMIGTDQQNAKMMGEIYVWDGKNLETKDMFIWQSKPGEDTRPSCGVVFKDINRTGFVIATSRGTTENRAPELDIRRLNYAPAVGAMGRYRDFIKACNEKCVEGLKPFASPESVLAPLALEALAVCGDGKAAKVMGTLLHTPHEPLFLRAVELLRNMGAEGIDELRGIGFSVPDDWAIMSPFDNTDNGGFDAQYPPEVEVDLNTFYAGKDRIVRWGKIDDDHERNGYINLGHSYFDSIERTGIGLPWNRFNTRSVAYLLTYIQCPADMEVQFKVGSTDGVKVWLDDELVHSVNLVRDALLDQDIIPVSLKEGRNKVLVKVANHKTNGWGVFFRVTDTEGKPVPSLRYERPEVSHIHNQMLTCEQLLSLLDAQGQRSDSFPRTRRPEIRCLAATQLASSGDRRGNESLAALLQTDDTSICAKAALALTLAGDSRGVAPLAKLAPSQDYPFQVAAGYALKRFGDALSEQFSIDNLRDDTGEKVVEVKVEDKQDGFRLSLTLGGDETAHVGVYTNMRFNLGDNISASCASIHGFGTDFKYRGIGMGGAAIRKALEVMAEMEHSCSVVTTGTELVAHRLYSRNGYVNRRFPWGYEKQLGRNDTDENDGKIKTRDYINADEAEIRRLIEQYLCNTMGLADWWSPRSDFGPWIRVAEDEGKVIGYADVYLEPFEPTAKINILHTDKEYKDEPAAVRALLSHIHKYALAEGRKTLSFGDPPVRYRDILLNMGYNIEPTWVIDYGWVNMFKVIDLTRLLREIVDLLKLRLLRSPLAGWCGSIGIRGSRLNSILVIGSDGDMTIEDDDAKSADITIIADDRLITNLISGNADVWESYRQHTLTVHPIFNERIRRLIESLFPILPHRQGGWW